MAQDDSNPAPGRASKDLRSQTQDRPRTITQGHPTGADPSANKGGQNGAPKPDGRSAKRPGEAPRRG